MRFLPSLTGLLCIFATSHSQTSDDDTSDFCIIGRNRDASIIDGEYVYEGILNGYPYYKHCCNTPTEYLYKPLPFYYVISDSLIGYENGNYSAYCQNIGVDTYNNSDMGTITFSIDICDGYWHICKRDATANGSTLCAADDSIMSDRCDTMKSHSCEDTPPWLSYDIESQICVNNSGFDYLNGVWKYTDCDEGFPYYTHSSVPSQTIHWDWGVGAYIVSNDGSVSLDSSVGGRCYEYNFADCGNGLYLFIDALDEYQLDTDVIISNCQNYTQSHVTETPMDYSCGKPDSICMIDYKDAPNLYIHGEYYPIECDTNTGIYIYEHCCSLFNNFQLYYLSANNWFVISREITTVPLEMQAYCDISKLRMEKINQASTNSILNACSHWWNVNNGSGFHILNYVQTLPCRVMQQRGCKSKYITDICISGFTNYAQFNGNWDYNQCFEGFPKWAHNEYTLFFDWELAGWTIVTNGESDRHIVCFEASIDYCNEWGPQPYTETYEIFDSNVVVSLQGCNATNAPTTTSYATPTPAPTFATNGSDINSLPDDEESNRVVMWALFWILVFIVLCGGGFCCFMFYRRRKRAVSQWRSVNNPDDFGADTAIAMTNRDQI